MKSMIKIVLLSCAVALFSTVRADSRRVISLNGVWQIAEGAGEESPKNYERQIPVPGLVDLARPPFAGVGFETELRKFFWYRRTFRIDSPLPEAALLKIHKAKYGTRVYINGALVGDHLPCFTPAYFDVRDVLKGGGLENEIVVRVGADRSAVPDSIPDGSDFEKYKYIPGIYDDVELILSGSPYIVNVQAVPQIEKQSLRIVTYLQSRQDARIQLSYTIREAATGKIVARSRSEKISMNGDESRTVDHTVGIENPHLWSPEDPFLYELEVDAGTDRMAVRVGMRSFTFDKKSGRAILNGKPYYMRGTNVCIYRFFEDGQRGYKPWDRNWVRRLHEKFKQMHWNSIRYCIGFPPELWYEVADEVGFLIQDEFPIWYLSRSPEQGGWPTALTHRELAREYADWMRERWNHASVVIWDAQNETTTRETGKAIQRVRRLDLSDRPWDNGWGAAQGENDCTESHPYLFIRNWKKGGGFVLKDMKEVSPKPKLIRYQTQNEAPIIINEYAWLWLNRDGTPTSLTHNVYNTILGRNPSVAQLRYTYARYLAALTEFWRCHRQAAGVLHFCGLGYSRPGGLTRPFAGATSDHFLDLDALNFEPNFAEYVRDAFAPVGLMIDRWDDLLPAGAKIKIPVYVINDLPQDWQGQLTFYIRRGNDIVARQQRSCTVKSMGRTIVEFEITIPEQNGSYQFIAEYTDADGEKVQSLRDFAASDGR